MRLLFIIDPIQTLNPKKDSTLALLRAAARRNDALYIAAQHDLRLVDNAVQVKSCPLEMADNGAEESRQKMSVGEADIMPATFFHVVMMRKEPPVDENFITATHLLEKISPAVPVINAPQALRDMNEKLSIFNFPDLIPPTWVGSDWAAAAGFCRAHKQAVLKPLNGMGGQGIYVSTADDMNFRSVFELLSREGRSVMLQAYLPAVREGDCRLLVVNGEALPWMVVRIPRPDDHRGNMAAGGRPEVRRLDAAAERIGRQVAPALSRAGVQFAGLDIIGGRLIEINITCPTGLCEVAEQTGEDAAAKVMEALTAAVAV